MHPHWVSLALAPIWLHSSLMAEENEQHASDGDNSESNKSNNNNNQSTTLKPVPDGMIHLIFCFF